MILTVIALFLAKMNGTNGKTVNGVRRLRQSNDDPKKEKVLLERFFTIHYPSSSPTSCQVSLTSTELILEECDEADNDFENIGREERYPIKDIFGFHIIRKNVDEPSLTVVYACIIFYTFPDDKTKTRSRVARVFEVNQPQHSYEENLSVLKDWAVQIGKLLKAKYPNCYKGQGSGNEKVSTSEEDSIERSFQELISSNKEDAQSNNDTENEDKDNTVGIDLEFDESSFSLVKSILFNRRYLVVVNPVSGQGKGANLLEECILPIFADSGIEVDLLTTQHAGHARSYITTTDLTNIDGIVSVGGDGLLNEIVNGLRSEDSSGKFAKMPIGVVATGSGNGVARSMADYCSSKEEYLANPTLHSTLSAARGCVVPINLTEVSLDKKVLRSFLSVGWGLMSDIDIESEVLRSIGEIRFFIWAFLKLAKLRRYKAELSYIPYDASGTVSSRVKVDDEFVCVYSACQSYIGSYLLFAPDAKQNDKLIHLAYLPSSAGRLAAAKFLHYLDQGKGDHLKVSPVKYVKVKEFTLRCEGGIEGCLTMDGEQIQGEEMTVKVSDSPLYVLSMG